MPLAHSRRVPRLSFVALLVLLCLSQPALTASSQAMLITLYNGTGSPGGSGQGLMYLSDPLVGASAKQIGANLDTTPTTGEKAGFFSRQAAMPVLDRQAGYTLRFAVRVNDERHAGSDRNDDSIGDRAGFSVILLSSDGLGIELGFWPDSVWAQEDGAAEPPHGTLFTHAESGPWDTTQATIYDLVVQGDGYTLRSGETTILSGDLRDYRAFDGDSNVYVVPNFLFLGDDTGSASANVDFVGPITLSSNDVLPPDQRLYLPLLFGA